MYQKIYRNMRILCIFTMILTAALILSACYSVFESRIKEEIRSETRTLAEMVDGGMDIGKVLGKIEGESEEHRITLIDRSGAVIYDSYGAEKYDNHLERKEVSEAMNKGAGEALRFSDTMKSRVFYYAVRLEDGNVLRVSRVTQNNLLILLQLVWPAIFVLVMLYILCVIIAVRLTENITKPFLEINFTDEGMECEYEELQPFLNRIKGQQEEIRHQIKRVEMQKSRLQTISESMNEGLVVLDGNENILSVNKSALEVFGACENDVIHKNFMYLCRDISLREHLTAAFSGGKNSMEFVAGEKHYQIFLSPVFENGRTHGVVMLIFDISERFETEQIRREFSSNVSHELKTPITTILGYSQIINKGIAKPEDIRNFTEKIEKETSRLIKLIDDIIKLSRLDDEENSGIEMQEIHLKRVAEDTFERLSSYADEKNITMECVGDDMVIKGNLVQITELLYNLCENALKYNVDGGKVTVSLKDGILCVSDTGIGIPKEYQKRVFERFFRVDKSRSKSVNGTGLGLSIVKHIVKCHNAKLELESEPGKGTAVKINFS